MTLQQRLSQSKADSTKLTWRKHPDTGGLFRQRLAMSMVSTSPMQLGGTLGNTEASEVPENELHPSTALAV